MSNDHAALARRRTDQTSGSDVNYYLIELLRRSGGRPVVVEVEDVIEALDMRFAEANVFKAIVRSAKLRQDLGKPGSSRIYEAQKAVYYSARTLAKARRRMRLSSSSADSAFGLDQLIVVDEPKRLEPYSVTVGEIVEALDATADEAAVLTAIMEMCIVMRDMDAPMVEVRIAQDAVDAAARNLEDSQGNA